MLSSFSYSVIFIYFSKTFSKLSSFAASSIYLNLKPDIFLGMNTVPLNSLPKPRSPFLLLPQEYNTPSIVNAKDY